MKLPPISSFFEWWKFPAVFLKRERTYLGQYIWYWRFSLRILFKYNGNDEKCLGFKLWKWTYFYIECFHWQNMKESAQLVEKDSSLFCNSQQWAVDSKKELIGGNFIWEEHSNIYLNIFLENYSLFEYFLTQYSNNNFLLNKPYKNVNFQTIFPKKILKILKTLKNPI
jgi:hypothetical protein